jgi:hypothetical protein
MQGARVHLGQLRQQIEDALSQGLALKQGECPTDASFGNRCRLAYIIVPAIFPDRFGESESNVIDIERPQQKPPASRPHRWQFTAGRMTDQQNERPLRGLFQNFQERVGSFALQVIDCVDNGNTPASLAGG